MAARADVITGATLPPVRQPYDAPMPLRPAPYTWTLPSLDLEGLIDSARRICERFGFVVSSVVGEDEVPELRVEGDAEAVEAAAAHFDSSRDDIEPPCEGERYRIAFRLLEPDDEDPRARMEVLPYDDNWATWSVTGPLAEDLAAAVGGSEITGDPPLWIQRELATTEEPTPERLPFLAVRAPSLFPGFATTTTFGREASVRSIARLLELAQVRVVLVLQSDPARDQLPTTMDDLEPVAIDARILRAFPQDDSFILVLKGIARLHVRALDLTAELPSVLVTPIAVRTATAGSFTSLRSFASSDPFSRDAAGTSLLAEIENVDAGMLADLVAMASKDAGLATRALAEIDSTKRAQLVESAIGES